MKHDSLISAEDEAANEYTETRKVSRITLENNISDFNALDDDGLVRASFRLEGEECPWKQLIFRALKAAYNQICINDETAVSNKEAFFSYAQDLCCSEGFCFA